LTPVLRVAPGVAFTVVAPAGFRILAALVYAATRCGHDLTITSACDGTHSGVEDPHHRGEAYDVRTHDLPDPQLALTTITQWLGEDRFFGWLEAAGTANEHIHVQVKKGVSYP
jgi:hypothetical protein